METSLDVLTSGGPLWEVRPRHGRDAGAAPVPRPLGHEALQPPHPALPRRRWLFDPVQGWFRRLERGANLFLSYHLLPRVPFIDRPYGWQLDRFLTVSEADIPIAGLPLALEGVRLLLITDIHTGPFVTQRSLQRTFGRLMELRPDVILLGGDHTTSHVADFLACRDAFASLHAPLGVFGVLGNHDHYTEDPPRLVRMMENAGIRMLQNRAVPLRRGGAQLILAGIDDLNAGRCDLAATLTQAESLRQNPPAPIVLRSHNPDVFFQAARRGVALVLSGHTHGGQIRLPGLPVLVRMSRYHLDQGRYTAHGAELVVSRGLGASGIPLRFGCSPEVGLFRLRARR